jgi:hypothetical protein
VRTTFDIYVLTGDPVDAEMKDTTSLLAVDPFSRNFETSLLLKNITPNKPSRL